jgi:hypothetical protein
MNFRMPFIDLTTDEIRFLDQYVRELSVGAGPATEQLHQRGIMMDPDLFGPLTYLWNLSWCSRNQEFPYPRQDDPDVVCPWPTKEVMIERSNFLKRMIPWSLKEDTSEPPPRSPAVD